VAADEASGCAHGVIMAVGTDSFGGDMLELEALAAAGARDDARRIGARAQTVGAAAAREVPLLNPLPAEPFDVSLSLSCRVDAKARVCVRQSYYSVPARFAGRRLQVHLGATTVTAFDAGKVVAEHTRSLHKGSEDLVLDHYLEVPDPQARCVGRLHRPRRSPRLGCVSAPPINGSGDAARRALGDAAGTRALVGVLLLHRTLPAEAVTGGMAAALTLDNFDPDLVAVEARRVMLTQQPAAAAPVPLPTTASPAAALQRPTPSLSPYDQLLTGAGA